MPLNAKISVALSAKLTGSPDLSNSEVNTLLELAVSLTNGVLAGQADRIFADAFSIAASGNTDLDLVGTSLIGPDNVSVSFARIKALIVSADAANTNNVVVGAAASNPWVGLLGATHTLTLRPGAFVAAAAGPADLAAYATVASTGDLLRLANSGAGSAVTGKIIVIGASA